MTRLLKSRLLYVLISLLLTAPAIAAQSGRRAKSGSTTAPTTTPTPTITGAKATEKKPATEQKLQLLVGMDRQNPSAVTPMYVYDTVLEDCVRRLGEADQVLPTARGNMTRGDARKAAKQETVRWVVSLEVRSVNDDIGRSAARGQDELYVEYTVVEPGTGNIKRSGRTNHHIYQNGRGGVTSPSRNGGIYSEYSIQQAALEAAERILAGFDIKLGDAP